MDDDNKLQKYLVLFELCLILLTELKITSVILFLQNVLLNYRIVMLLRKRIFVDNSVLAKRET